MPPPILVQVARKFDASPDRVFDARHLEVSPSAFARSASADSP
jgi:hypothetical protein